MISMASSPTSSLHFPRQASSPPLYGATISAELEARLLHEARQAIATLVTTPQHEHPCYAVGDVGGWIIA